MNWNWDPRTWKTSTKLLLGLATVWPPIYMVLFIGSIFSMFLFLPFAQDKSSRRCGDIDVFQLEDKIKAGEIKQLTVKPFEIDALDRAGNCEFDVSVSNKFTRDRLLRTAREQDEKGNVRVPKIDEETSEPVSPILPIGIVVLFGAHFITIILTIGLMPLYIILAVKDERHDQTTRIIWVVLLATMGMLANPVYWYLYVWRKVSPVAAPLSNPI